ncbi:UNVERIFIED_CONTAM: hypothetical protein K2H54_061939 [Gekko kuhli]
MRLGLGKYLTQYWECHKRPQGVRAGVEHGFHWFLSSSTSSLSTPPPLPLCGGIQYPRLALLVTLPSQAPQCYGWGNGRLIEQYCSYLVLWSEVIKETAPPPTESWGVKACPVVSLQ